MPGSYFSTNNEKMVKLMKVALGEVPADLAIVNGDVVNVYTGEVMKRHTVLIKEDCIAFVGGKAPHGSIDNSTNIIDASGKTLIPGLIDAHTHADDQYLAGELVKWALKRGTTTIISEVSAPGSLLGYKGVLEFIKEHRNQPVRFFVTVPPIVAISPSASKNSIPTLTEFKKMLRRKEVIGLGELSWAQLNENNTHLFNFITATINAGKKADGHAAGARDNKLQAYFTTGISSCHEPITAEEVIERLRLGVFVPVREGAVRKELREISKIKDAKIDFRNLALCADLVDPRQLVNEGYMDFIVQKAINYGFEPVTAIQMASSNAALHYGLDFLGGIAPGKLADIVIIPDLKTIKTETVIVGGKIAVSEGRLIMPLRRHKLPDWLYHTIRLNRDFTTADFSIRADGTGPVKVRVIDQVADLVTREAIIEMPVTHGIIEADIGRDILKVAAINRYWNPGKLGIGFIRGFGMKRGAIATSRSWDCAHIVVVGTNDADIAAAVNRIRKLQGGTVIYADGKILTELPQPVEGLCSDAPMEFIAQKYDEIWHTAKDLGTKLPDIYMSLQVLTTPSIPFFRICEEGLYDLKQNRIVSLYVTN